MVYVISDGNGYVKIGVAENVKNRLRGLQTGNAMDLFVIKTIRTANRSHDMMLESALHKIYDKYRRTTRNGVTEWFDQTEMMKLFVADVEDLYNLLHKKGISGINIRKVTNYSASPKPHDINILGPSGRNLLDVRTISIIESAGFKTVEALRDHIDNSHFCINGIGDRRQEKIEKALNAFFASTYDVIVTKKAKHTILKFPTLTASRGEVIDWDSHTCRTAR